MSRLKRCELPECGGVISRANPHVVKLVSLDEGLGQPIHGYTHPNDDKCTCCGGPKDIKIRPIKIKVCGFCYDGFKQGFTNGLVVGGIFRWIESFDPIKNIAYYTIYDKAQAKKDEILMLNEEKELYDS